MEKPVIASKNMEELMYHFKEEHRLRKLAERALEKANLNCHRHQQVAKEYRTQIENLNGLIHDFLCQRSKLEQVVVERNAINARYEKKFAVMEREMNILKNQLQHKKVTLTDQRVAVFREKVHCLEEENEMLHEKLWRLKRRYVDKSVSTDELERRNHRIGKVAMSLNANYEFSAKDSISPEGILHTIRPKSADSHRDDNSDDEVSELLKEWKRKSVVIEEQKQLLAAKLQQLEDERNSESNSFGRVPYKSFEYTNSISSANITPARTINSHDDEVFLTSASIRAEQNALTEIRALESKCAGLPGSSGVDIDEESSWLARRDVSRNCSSPGSVMMNGRTIELFTSDDSYEPEDGLLNEQLYNLPDHKLVPAVRENLIHIRVSKYGGDVLTQSAPSRVSLIDFVRDGGYAADGLEETEAMNSFNFLKDFSEVLSEPGVYTSDGTP